MKVLILAGGFGSRLGEMTDLKPKPMIEIGSRPILWHIMKQYSSHGFNDFIILLGYKGYQIKEYFANYLLHQSDITIDLKNNSLEFLNKSSEPWKVTLLDTGLNTMTGGRVKQARQLVGNSSFMLTYGDGVSNIDINELVSFHKSHGKTVTMTAVRPEGRFGAVEIDENSDIKRFIEKPIGDSTSSRDTSFINGGFFVCEPSLFDLIPNETDAVLERQTLEKLVSDNQMVAYKHTGFWKCMDTLRDKNDLESLWQSDSAPWKIW